MPFEPSVTGLYIAWRFRHQSKSEFLSSNRTQKGQIYRRLRNDLAGSEITISPFPPKAPIVACPAEIDAANKFPAIPLAMNFIASGECISACATPS